ncbi:MAG: glycosyltransferase family 4 protein [Planctomycetota bacterium]
MRVLLVSHVAPPHIGGVESIVQMEAEAFRDAGHDVVWVTSNADGDGSDVPEGERLRVRRVWAWHLLERLFGIAFPLFAPTLPLYLWREVGRADLVHVHGLVFPGSPIAALFARMRGTRCICTDHGGMLQYPSRLANGALWLLMATVGRMTARGSHKLVALNHDVEALLVRLAGRPDKVQFLPNPVDVAMFQPPAREERCAARAELGWDERPRVLCVSRLLPHKGIDVLLAAKDPSFELVFCGPGDPEVRERLRASGAECLEPRPRHQILTLYHAADAFALPSHNEGFPVVVQEALACGLPVITSDLPAYAAYRQTPGLTLCKPTAEIVRKHLLQVLAIAPSQRQRAASAADDASSSTAAPAETSATSCERTRWLAQLCAATAATANAPPPTSSDSASETPVSKTTS